MRLVPVPKRLLVDVYEALGILRGYATGGSPPEWDPVVDEAREGLERALRIGVQDVYVVSVPPRVSEVCRSTHVQSCHVCEDLDCVDNQSPVKQQVRALTAELESLRNYTNVVEDENAALLAELGPYRSGACHACNVDAALGTEECPHPVDARVHTCDRNIEVDPSAVIVPRLRHLICGCVTCVCEDPVRCHGCGAKMCQEHARRGATMSVEEDAKSGNRSVKDR